MILAHRHRRTRYRRAAPAAVRHREHRCQRPADAHRAGGARRAGDLLPREPEPVLPYGCASHSRGLRRVLHPAHALQAHAPALHRRVVVDHRRLQRHLRPHRLRHIGGKRRAEAPHQCPAAAHLHGHRTGAPGALRQLLCQRLRHRPLIHHPSAAAVHRLQITSGDAPACAAQCIAEREAVPVPRSCHRQCSRLSDDRVSRRQGEIPDGLHPLHRQGVAVAVVSGGAGAAVQSYTQRCAAHSARRRHPAAVILNAAAPPAGGRLLQRIPAVYTVPVHIHRQIDRVPEIGRPRQRCHRHIDAVLHVSAGAPAVVPEAHADPGRTAPLDAVQRRIAHLLTLRSTGRPVRPPPLPRSTARCRQHPAP